MKRLILPLLLLTAACAGTPAPRSAEQRERDSAVAACRQDAERQMRYRERGQTMRVDEAESRLGAGAFVGNPLGRDQLAARFEQDRMIAECLRGQEQPLPGGGSMGVGRGS